MIPELSPWDRPYYEPGADPLLFYVVFGEFRTEIELSRSAYRSDGAPEGVAVTAYRRSEAPDLFATFLDGALGRLLAETDGALRDAVHSAPACVIVSGSVPDPVTLDYLRDTVGLVTYLLDAGGVAVLDSMALQWWQLREWRQEVFEADGPAPTRHATILVTEDETNERGEKTVWVHTRGMRKFGRPDISVRGVTRRYVPPVVDLCNRFIVLQAFGGVLPEGQEVNLPGLPAGMTCHHAGSLDDPDFNNVHVDVRWPTSVIMDRHE